MEWVIRKKAKERPEEWYSNTYMATDFYFDQVLMSEVNLSKETNKQKQSNRSKAGNASIKMAPFKKVDAETTEHYSLKNQAFMKPVHCYMFL